MRETTAAVAAPAARRKSVLRGAFMVTLHELEHLPGTRSIISDSRVAVCRPAPNQPRRDVRQSVTILRPGRRDLLRFTTNPIRCGRVSPLRLGDADETTGFCRAARWCSRRLAARGAGAAAGDAGGRISQ